MTVEIWQRQKRSEDEINKLARKILAEMTLEQKVNQMSGDSFYTKEAVDNMMENGYNLEPYYAGRDEELGIPQLHLQMVHGELLWEIQLVFQYLWQELPVGILI